MSFQWIINNAESISINRKPVVASTTARDGTTRSVSRGGQAWRFEVKLPEGLRWSDIRQYISLAEALNQTQTANIQINSTGHAWLSKYQGDNTLTTPFTGTWTKGSTTLTLGGGAAQASGYKFRAGDFIQLGTGNRVYTVAADVAYNATTVTLNRPILDTSGTGTTLIVGQNVTWTVLCSQFPEWTIFQRDQVSWSGPFIFVENLV